jgi:hypothetical protein
MFQVGNIISELLLSVKCEVSEMQICNGYTLYCSKMRSVAVKFMFPSIGY